MPGTATLLLSTWLAADPAPPPAEPMVVVGRRELVLSGGPDFEVHGTWWLDAVDGPATLTHTFGGLIIHEAWTDGAPAAIDGDGRLVVTVDGPTRLEIRGHGAGPFVLPAAARGTLRVPAGYAPADAGHAPRGGVFVGAPPVLTVRRSPPSSPEGALIVSTAALGLTVEDTVATWSARVVWTALRGATTHHEVVVPGLPADAVWEAPGAVRRVGATLSFDTPPTARATLSVSWTTPVNDPSSWAVPPISTPGTLRQERSLQVARSGPIEVIPDVDGHAVSGQDLPAWARDLVTGTPTAAWLGVGGGSVTALHVTPLEGPPVVVDTAAWEVFADRDGRLLLRGVLDVRNDRAAWLRLTPPDGTLLSLTVDREPVSPRRDGGDWLLPLPRSVEAVEGLLSFPVEIVVLVDGPAWVRDRRVRLPVLDAEIAVCHTTVGVPRGWRPRRGRVGYEVPSFHAASDLTYGLGTTEAIAVADEAWQLALDAWLDNDFDEAQKNLDRLQDLGAANENTTMLQDNLDVVTGTYEGDVTAARRIKDQAKARAFEDEIVAQEALEVAEMALAAGDVSQAAASYTVAGKVAKKIAQLDQEEAVDLANLDRRAQAGLEAVFGQVDAPAPPEESVPTVARATGTLTETREEEEAVAPVVVDVTATSEGVVLDREFLQSIPTGRDYQSAVTMSAGAISGETGADKALWENTYMLDGANIVDPVRGTFSMDYKADRSDRTVVEAPKPAQLLMFGVGGVTATRVALQLPVPEHPIRFEHLVVAAGTPLVVDVRSKRVQEGP